MNSSSFPSNSRYRGIETATLELPEGQAARGGTIEGRTVVYLKRRFVPEAEQFQEIQEHTVTQGDRLDNLAAKYLGDPEQFWRICDANNALRPDELTEEIGRTLRITLPAGIAAPTQS